MLTCKRQQLLTSVKSGEPRGTAKVVDGFGFMAVHRDGFVANPLDLLPHRPCHAVLRARSAGAHSSASQRSTSLIPWAPGSDRLPLRSCPSGGLRDDLTVSEHNRLASHMA